MDLPAVAKVFGSLLLMLCLNCIGWRFSFSLGAGTLLLVALTGHSPDAAALIALRRTFSPDHLFLVVIIFQVICLSAQMSAAGVMRDLVQNLRGRLPRRAAMAVLPAVIGFLPMPGGAIFSAPLVDDCDHDDSVPPLLKAEINHWFRHIWEYWWPIYPGVLLALVITRIEIWQMMLVHVPLSLASVVGGYWFLLRHVHESSAPVPDTIGRSSHSLPQLVAPIAAVIVVYALVRLSLPAFAEFNRYIPMAMGLAGAAALLQWQRPFGWSTWRTILLSRKTLFLVLLVTLVRVYGAFIEEPLPNGMMLVEIMRDELTRWHIPALAAVMLVPLICGLATGVAIGFVGASFPVVMALIGTDPSPAVLLPTVMLAYGFGYVGMMLSPVHICLVVTNEHFGTRLLHSLRGLLGPTVVVLTVAIAWYAVLTALL